MRTNPRIKTALYKAVLTPEQEDAQAQHTRDFITEFQAQIDDITSAAPDLLEGQTKSAGRNAIKEFAGAMLEELISTYVGDSPTLKGELLNFVVKMSTEGVSSSEVLQKLGKIGDQGYLSTVMAEEQSNLAFLPRQIRRLLPRRLVIETDPSGKITKMTNEFMAIKATLDKKAKTMADLVKAYNSVVAQVRADLTSRQSLTQICAIVTSILMETGIRPGRPGERSQLRAPTGGYLKDPETNEPIYVDTFGATTLNHSHVTIVKDNFAKLEFMGKDAVLNVATLSDKAVIAALKSIMSAPKSNYIFTDFHGKVFSHTTLHAYFKAHFRGFDPSDFRDLKATEEHLSALRLAQSNLLARIKKHIDDNVADLKERVVDEIAKTIEDSLIKAQVALNHEKLENTINYYVNPVVTLSYLSTAEVESTLEGAVAGDLPALLFDIDKFIEKAKGAVSTPAAPKRSRKKKSSSVESESLLDVVDDLEEDLAV